jgi:NADH:ubiquinone oxidoreductase subunit 3 (subunit A)
LADHAGALTILALALLLVWALHALQRRLAPPVGPAEPGPAATGSAPGPADPVAPDPRTEPESRIHARFLVGALMVAIALAAVALLVPWATSVAELGPRALLGLAAVAGPPALGIAHARAKGRLEW